MQIRSDQAGLSLLNLLFSKAEGLQLQKGQLVAALVEKSLGDGLFMINIKGERMEAFTDLTLTPGQNLVLKSEGMEDGRLILRIVKPGEEQAARIAAHLQEIGYRVDDRLTAAAAKLIQYGLPLTRGNLDFMMNSTRLLGDFTPENLETAAWALAGGLKDYQEILTALRSFMTRPETAKPLLEQVLQYVVQAHESTEGAASGQTSLRPSAPGGTGPAVAPFPVPDGSKPVASGPAANPLTGEIPGNAIPTGPPVTRETPGSAIPAGLPVTVETPGNTIPAAGFPAGERSLSSIEGLLKTIILLITVQGAEDPESMRQDLQRFMGSGKEVIRALALAREALVNLPETVPTRLGEAAKMLQRAEGELLGQAVFNSVERQPVGQQPPGFYYFAIPWAINGRDQAVELRIYQDERGNRRLDELEEIRMAISLSTVNLGTVLFHVTWQKEAGLIIQGVVNNRPSKEIIEQNFDRLRQRLMEIGYPVQFLGMKVTAEPEELRPGFAADVTGKPIMGIDIRV